MTLLPTSQTGAANALEILDRVLDKGLVVVGDVSISVANLELLSLRLRLLLVSLDRAEELGMDLSWTGLDRARALPSTERYAVAGAPVDQRTLPTPAESPTLGALPEPRELVVAPEQLQRLERRLAKMERRLAQTTARQAPVRSSR
jgi:hypothetical protein